MAPVWTKVTDISISHLAAAVPLLKQKYTSPIPALNSMDLVGGNYSMAGVWLGFCMMFVIYACVQELAVSIFLLYTLY